jgi:membrane-bound serine protease (ClpP class)
MLFDPGVTGLKIPMQTIIPAVLTIVIFFLAIVYLVGKTQVSGWKQEKQILGMTGRIINWEDGQGKIKLRGEIWNCRGAEPGIKFSPGDTARVENASGLTLYVKPAEGHSGPGQK